ncbi:MAG: MFS transporter [Anaerolineales bacterium]|nr:MFS transporter [Anaerolineales bacterium]
MPNKRKNLYILFFTLVVVMLGFGMVIPILPFYIKEFGASGRALGALMATYAVMQFIFAPVWGSISDRIGRKPVLIVGVLGNALAQLLFGLSTQLWMLFAARILAGALSSASLPTAMAYIGDSTSARERGGGMGMLGAAMGIGMVLGPGLAGWLAERSLALPFFLAAGLSFAALLFIWAALPESLPPEARDTSGAKVRGPQVGEMWAALSSPIGFLLFLAFLISFGLTSFEGVFGLYALERFGYGPREVGLLLMLIGVISAAAQGALTGPLTRRWSEATVIKASLLASAIGFPLMLLARNLAGIVLTISFFILSNALLRPSVSSLTSQRAPGGQGVAMGLNNAFMSLGRSAGPLLAGFLFDANINLPYLGGAVIMMAGFAASLVKLESGQQAADDLPRPLPGQRDL